MEQHEYTNLCNSLLPALSIHIFLTFHLPPSFHYLTIHYCNHHRRCINRCTIIYSEIFNSRYGCSCQHLASYRRYWIDLGHLDFICGACRAHSYRYVHSICPPPHLFFSLIVTMIVMMMMSILTFAPPLCFLLFLFIYFSLSIFHLLAFLISLYILIVPIPY